MKAGSPKINFRKETSFFLVFKENKFHIYDIDENDMSLYSVSAKENFIKERRMKDDLYPYVESCTGL